MAAREVNNFYNELSPFYHLIFQNWEESILRQAKIIDSIIKQHWQNSDMEILDISCGIGTQSLGLSMLGYKVSGSDISEQAIERAIAEAKKRNLHIDYALCDMREIVNFYQQEFDIIICCDNSISHLLCDDEIRSALQQIYKITKQGGGTIITIRDYSDVKKNDVKIVPYGLKIVDDQKFIIFQIWTVFENYYDLDFYFINDDGGKNCPTKVMRTKYNLLPLDRLMSLMAEVGFQEVERVDCDYYQPVVIGKK